MSEHKYELYIKNTDTVHDIEGSPKPLVLNHIERAALLQKCEVQRVTTFEKEYTFMIVKCSDDKSNAAFLLTCSDEVNKYKYNPQY